MLVYAIRNFSQNKLRSLLSVGGVALALLLILALDAIFTGAERQIVAYMENAGADVFVAQAGVRNLHMVSSSLPPAVVDQVRAVPGVRTTTPLWYTTAMLGIRDERYVVYVMGLPPDAVAGGPWRITAGVAAPGPGEIVIDRGVAARAGVRLGDTVQVLNRDFTVAGLADGTANIVNSIVFIREADFVQLRGNLRAFSFVLVQVQPGVDPGAVAGRIEAAVPGVTAQSRAAFAAAERQVVRDMSTDLINIMNGVGFLIGLAVLALTIYTATFTRRAEYGVLKALGARTGHLYRTVLYQAVGTVAMGLVLAVLLTLGLAALVPLVSANLLLSVSTESLAKVSGAALLIAGLAALLPVQQIAGLDPARVFRGGWK